MPETLVLDPTSEDAANSPLTLTSGSYGLTEHKYPQPAIDPQWASSISTEGSVLASQRYQNREISITVEVDCTASLTPLRTLQAKLTKLAREGGTLQRTMGDATVVVFDVLTADGYDPSFDQAWHLGNITTVSFTLQCLPFGRGPEEIVSARAETTLPVNVMTVTGVKGDLPARGRLVITDAQGQDQRWVAWGVQSRHYSSATSAALFYEAEAMTALGGSAAAAGPTGASGAGSNVMRNSVLPTSHIALLSTQATGGGAHLSHIGSYRVMARVQVSSANVGAVSLALEWGTGDFRRSTRNADAMVDQDVADTWRIVDLGLVSIPKVIVGTQRWEGRILGRSTSANDRVDIDWLALFPVDEGYGEVRATYRLPSPTAFSARDDFNQAAGALTGKTPDAGAAWVGSGAATDFQVDAATHTLTRTGAVGERWVRIPTTLAATHAQVDVTPPTTGASSWGSGLIARWVDSSNYLYLSVAMAGTDWALVLISLVAGVGTILGYATIPARTTHRMRLLVAADGTCAGWVSAPDASYGEPQFVAQATSLATGGVLDDGHVGIRDYSALVGTVTSRTYDNFAAWVPSTDAAAFASQSLEVRHDRVIREDASGAYWQQPGSYQGDYLRVPVAGAEGRSARFIAKASRNDPTIGGDVAIDDLTLQLFYTPRYFAVPS